MVDTTACGSCPGLPLARKLLQMLACEGVHCFLIDQDHTKWGPHSGVSVARRQHNSRAPSLRYVRATT
jgi:hypothetical protein